MKPFTLAAACAVAGAIAATAPAFACTDTDCPYPPGDPYCARFTTTSAGERSVDLVMDFLQTAPATAGHGCAIAVSQIVGFDTVGVIVERRGTGDEEAYGGTDLSGAYGFRSNPVPAASLRPLAAFRDGFYGRLTADVEGGQKVRLRLRLRPTDGGGPEEASRAAEEAVIAVGAARADGRFSPEHLTVFTIRRD